MRADSLAVVVRENLLQHAGSGEPRWLERRGPRAGKISPQLASAVGKFCRMGRQEVSYV